MQIYIIVEPENDPCEFYFIQLIVKLNGVVVETQVTGQSGGICTVNVQPCNYGQTNLRSGQVSLAQNFTEIQATLDNSNTVTTFHVYNIQGIQIFNGNNEDEMNYFVDQLEFGIYICTERNSKEIVSVTKRCPNF